jgi:hypothetical protein
VLDAITMERRGIPSACVGVQKLAETTGRGMCRAQGLPEYPLATIAHPTGSLASVKDAETLSRYAASLADQVEAILTRGQVRSP